MIDEAVSCSLVFQCLAEIFQRVLLLWAMRGTANI